MDTWNPGCFNPFSPRTTCSYYLVSPAAPSDGPGVLTNHSHTDSFPPYLHVPISLPQRKNTPPSMHLTIMSLGHVHCLLKLSLWLQLNHSCVALLRLLQVLFCLISPIRLAVEFVTMDISREQWWLCKWLQAIQQWGNEYLRIDTSGEGVNWSANLNKVWISCSL